MSGATTEAAVDLSSRMLSAASLSTFTPRPPATTVPASMVSRLTL